MRWFWRTAIVAGLFPAAAFAGGALQYDVNGNAVGWSSSSAVPYRTDLGLLGNQSNAQATALVDGLFGQWQAVGDAVIAYQNVGPLAEDVTVANYGGYLGPFGGHLTPRGENAVVFDADGTIFDDLFGVGTGVLGFAGPTFLADGGPPAPVGEPAAAGSHIVEGVAFLNGKFVDGVAAPDNPEASSAIFQAAILHELGHFSGLDHTQIHPLDGFRRADGSRLGDASLTETMYPFIGRPEQATLAMDDRVALARLYPSSSFASATGCVTGVVRDLAGQPVAGIDVVALGISALDESVSDVTGANGLTGSGTYTLCGLVPGHKYALEIQEVDAFASGGSRIGPFATPRTLPGPPEAWNGIYEGTNPALDDPAQAVEIVAAAGVRSGLDFALNAQAFRVSNLDWTADGGPSDESPAALVGGDFDGDGRTDLVTAQQGFAPGNELRFAHGRGDGTFDPPARIDGFPGNVALAGGQFNAAVDAAEDFVALSGSSFDLRLYLGDGSGGFGAPATLVAGVPAVSAALGAGDLNGDGRADVVYLRAETDGSLTAIAELTNGTTFAPVTTTIPASAALRLTTGQSVLVGRYSFAPVDVVFALPDRPAIAILHGDGSGAFTADVQDLSSLSNRLGTALASADFDADGWLDLALPDYAPVGATLPLRSAAVDILRAGPFSGLTLASRTVVAEPLLGSLLAADFDRDGRADVVAAGAFLNVGEPGAKVQLLYGDGRGGVRPVAGPLAPQPVAPIWGLAEFPAALFPGEMVSADLDGDGRRDLVVSDHSTNVFGVQFPARLSVLMATDLPDARATGFFTLTPCRLFDTRSGAPLSSGQDRTFQLGGACGIPAGAVSLSVNVTVVDPSGVGSLQMRGGPLGPVTTATVSSFRSGRTRANNAIVKLAADGSGKVVVTSTIEGGGTVHVILDVNGYFQ